VNKAGFSQLVTDYSNAESKIQDLEKLLAEYPYSQPIRMLNLRGSQHLSKSEFQQRLGLAAFYSTDRNVLRSLIEQGKVPSELSKPKNPSKKATAANKSKKAAPKSATAQKRLDKTSLDIDALRDEVLFNLETLQKNKAHFLEITGEGTIEIVKPKTQTKSKEKTRTKATTTPKATKARATSQKKTATGLKKNSSKKAELIDKFIADEPTITPNSKPEENPSDLSKASSVLKEDLVSENLAIIFANQGKTAKAIDIYKKLIWKFPQKKASFAARIEELKKK